jgi:signal transduction histidine kinase
VEPVFTPGVLDQDKLPPERPEQERPEQARPEQATPEQDQRPGQESPAGDRATASGSTTPEPALAEAETAAAPAETSSSNANWRIEERDSVRISVQDHGVGIPTRDLDRIFERFYRVDHGRSRDTGGTGLGLSIVRHVANNHQGWVDVESREGEGSTFTLVLPVQQERIA